MSVIGSVRGVARQMALVELCLVMCPIQRDWFQGFTVLYIFTHSAQTIFTRADFLGASKIVWVGVLFDLTKGTISIRIVCV